MACRILVSWPRIKPASRALEALTTRPSGNPPSSGFLYKFPLAAIMKHHELGGLQQKCIVSQFWKLEIQNQGVSTVMLSLMVLGRKLRKSFWRWLASLKFHDLQLHHCSLCLLYTASSSVIHVLLSGTPDAVLRPTKWFHLELITSAKTVFPNKAPFTDTRG